MKTALLVALLAGAKRGEGLAMRWADIDLHQAIWRIPIRRPDAHPGHLCLNRWWRCSKHYPAYATTPMSSLVEMGAAIW